MKTLWLVTVVGIAVLGSEARADSIVLVRDHKAAACIVCDQHADALVQEAAQLAQRIIRKSTGARLKD